MRTQITSTLILAWLCSAGTAFVQADDGGPSKATKPTSEGQLLKVTPRAIKQPLMKYRLLPAEYELKDGNAAPILLRLPWEQQHYFNNVMPTFTDYLDLPLDDPKVLNSERVFKSQFYNELKRAAYRRTAEWEYPIGEEPSAMIGLPDVQGSRDILGRGLPVRIRYHIANGHIDEALEGIKVGLANSRHYGRTPFVITQLVCTAIDSIMLNRLEELIAHADCPNLYWALTTLPRPLIDTRSAVEFEQRFLQTTVPGLDNLDALHTESEWSAKLKSVYDLMRSTDGDAASSNDEFDRFVTRLTPRARKELLTLIDGGTDRVKAMSDAETGLRWFMHVHKQYTEEATALTSLEPTSAIPRLTDLQKRIAKFRSELGASPFMVETPLSLYVVTGNVQRKIDALRVVEALRQYAATHDSKWPTSLSEISETPIPDDYITGQPFGYEIENGAAIVTAPGISLGKNENGEILRGAIHYRIELREQK